MKRISLILTTTALMAAFSLYGQDEPPSEALPEPPAEPPPGAMPTNTIPSNKPLIQTEVEAESLRAEITEEEGYLIGVGSVKLTATNLTITCNQIEVFTDVKDKDGTESIGDFSSIQKIIATGNVKIVQDERTATAGKAEIFPNDDFIRLDGDPIVYQNNFTMDGTGAQLLIHRGNGRVEWIGSKDNKIRFTGPAIQDFGFEEDPNSIVPPEEENANPESTEDAATDDAQSATEDPQGKREKPRKRQTNN